MDYWAPNRKNLRKRANYGIRVARPGYDANECAQNQLLFNSSWPMLQIVKIVKLDNFKPAERIVLDKTTTVVNLATGEILEKNTESSFPTSVPEGYINVSEAEYDPDNEGRAYRDIAVNKRYIKKPLAGIKTIYFYNGESSVIGDILTEVSATCVVSPIGVKTHSLGYTPFFLPSEVVSDVKGYLLLFSINITEDVDYPYTEKPLALLSPPIDYGIKSTSCFGKKVPGLCSDMFSKLVQAVKTEKTSRNESKYVIWSPVEKPSEAKARMLLPFEFYSFIAEENSGVAEDGGTFYKRWHPYYIGQYDGKPFDEAWAVMTGIYPLTLAPAKSSLVVLRSPMVSPEYEERIV